MNQEKVILIITKQKQKEKQMNSFIEDWQKLAKEINETAKKKGWWDEERNKGEMIALMHSELSEALEALRHGNPPDDKIPKYSGLEAELADTVIRIMDFGHAFDLDVGRAIIAKKAFNETRSYKHGGKNF